MVRPKDLPQPVRPHNSHESLADRARYTRAPGPGAYGTSNGVQKSTTLGFFGKAQRFKREQLVPEDQRTKEERDNFLDTPGPKYIPYERPTRISTSFGSAATGRGGPQQQAAAATSTRSGSQGPGPGEYQTNMDWSKGVSFTRSTRRSQSATGSSKNGPSPSSYTPLKPKVRDASVSFTKGGRGPSFGSKHRVGEDAGGYTSLAAMDKGTNYISRAPIHGIGFSMAPRSSSATPKTTNVGPGAYNVFAAKKVQEKSCKAAKFGTAKRNVSAASGSSTRSASMIAAPRPDVLSGHVSAPSVGFSKTHYDRGIPNDADTEVPTAAYNPSWKGVEPNPRGVSIMSAGRPGSAPSRPQSADTETARLGDATNNPLRSSLDGPSVSFTKASRSKGGVQESLATGTPGPGAYTPSGRKRPDSASQSFTRGKRNFNATKADTDVPGPKYTPDYTKTRAPLGYDISFSQGQRPQSATRASSSGPHGTSYSPSYNAVDKRPRSAVLYLTG